MRWLPLHGDPNSPPWTGSPGAPPKSSRPRRCLGSGCGAPLRSRSPPRPQVLKVRGLLEENYQPATANRMLSALRGVLRECWQAQLMTTEEYQAAINVPAVRGESEHR